MKKSENEEAFTGFELIILVVVVLAIGGLLVFFLSNPGAAGIPHGLVANTISLSGASLRLVGGVTGFSAINGHVSDVVVEYPVPSSQHLGGIEMTTALFIGNSGGIDMDKATITWISKGVSEKLRKSDRSPVICPNWSIAGKFNMLPMQHADADNILEPNEQFELFICPTNTTMPNQEFTIKVDPAENALSLPVIRNAPSLIKPIMQLG
jgi:hypothetical protein